jgi:hypothetical protein
LHGPDVAIPGTRICARRIENGANNQGWAMEASAIEIRQESNRQRVIAVGIGVFLLIVLFFRMAGMQILQSDVRDYVDWSREWWYTQDKFHLPVYPIVIWLARTVTFGLFGDALLLQFVALIAWCASVYFVAKTLELLKVKHAHWGVALYALFPCVGVAYAAWPISDAIAHATLAFAILSMYRKSWYSLTATLAIMLLIHKALWPFALLLGLVAIFRQGYPFFLFIMSGVPFMIYWLIGVVNGESALWMVHSNLAKEMSSHSDLPLFDGVFGTLMKGGAKGLFKGGLLLLLLLGTLWLLIVHAKRRAFEMLALILPVIALLAILNQWEAWASLRFGRVLAIPAIMALQPAMTLPKLERRPWTFWAFVTFLALTQIAFAIYMNHFFASRSV